MCYIQNYTTLLRIIMHESDQLLLTATGPCDYINMQTLSYTVYMQECCYSVCAVVLSALTGGLPWFCLRLVV